MENFLGRVMYQSIRSYSDIEGMNALDGKLCLIESSHSSGISNRLFYFAVPPSVFLDLAATIKATSSNCGFTRLVVEKPFGSNYSSATHLADGLASLFSEDQIFRIDHYLAKEMVANILVLRFANTLFRNIWDRSSINNVQITFKEDFGTKGRGGYFDQSGIIRDILQNHLMQILALVAMEEPAEIQGPRAGTAVRDSKVALLKQIRPIALSDVVIAQYIGSESEAGYLDDPSVPEGSTTPTFAAIVLFIDNDRWRDVPFILKAGKALDKKKAEVRIQLNDVPGAVQAFGGKVIVPRNEIVLQVQPDEAVYLKANMKTPGLEHTPEQVTNRLNMTSSCSNIFWFPFKLWVIFWWQYELDLSYKDRFADEYLPGAYTRLLLDTLLAKQEAFVRSDELLEAWQVES